MSVPIHAVLVDVGGTLWPDKWPVSADHLYLQRLTAALRALSRDQIIALLSELNARDPGLGGGESQNTYLSVVAALHAIGLSDRHAAAVLHAMDVPALGVIEPFSGAKHLLGTIQGLGMRCVVFSNATWRSTASYWRDFRAFSLSEYIDEIISSVDLGDRKPSLRMFHAAVHAAERPPQECVVVGDSEERDIAPGVRLGMRPLRVAIERPPPTHTAAHAVVTSLRDAATTLLRWKEVSDATRRS